MMNRTEVSDVWLTDNAVWLKLKDGRQAAEKFSDYRRLASATEKEREKFELSYFGIHWPDIDEDLSYSGFFNK
ncbi:MAG: DUF2442 domain-containing protein [Bacteroidales bacterium]|nr:DUF2442 domain-containing protein [Bacteroidales bacterium]